MNGYWLNHNVEMGEYTNYEKFINTIFNPETVTTFEYIIGAIASGYPFTQKCVIISGPPASGKSILLNLVYNIFEGYTFHIDSFDNICYGGISGDPKILVMHDFDPKRLRSNETFHKFIMGEPITIDRSFKKTYKRKYSGILFAATNSDREIEDAIILHTTGNHIEPRKSFIKCVQNMYEKEIGHIIDHCITKWRSLN